MLLNKKLFTERQNCSCCMHIDRKDLLQYPVLGQKIGVARTFKQFVPRLAE